MNNYIHVLDAEGKRITSIVDNMLEPVGEETLLKQAKEQYHTANSYIYGDDAMLDEFLNGKAYVNGTFIDIPVTEYEPTKAERIAQIRKYYDERFATLDQALLRRRLANVPYDDLQEQFKKLNAEMVAKIKGVK
jgi:hypothetical protein